MKSCCDELHLLSIEDALSRMTTCVSRVQEAEQVPLLHAIDRVLAQDIVAGINVPAYANSAMDGYALRAEDVQHATQPLRLIGSALAGHPFINEVVTGTCVRITTGAPIPAGADCVVMQENTQTLTVGDQPHIQINHVPQARDNIRRCGEDIAEGELVVARGKRLSPLDIGLIASLGIPAVEVYRRLRIAVASTGDELRPPGHSLPVGGIYDSNRYGIIAFLQRLAVEVIDIGVVPDQPDAIRTAFTQAAEQADAIVSSGGVSVGDADFVKEILSEQGHINFWKVAIKPGKPFAFGQLGNSQFFGLPGNPVSAMVTLHQLALPVLRHMAGEQIAAPTKIIVKAGSPLKKRAGRVDYQRGKLVVGERGTCVHPNGSQGSGVMTSFSGADCYIVLERDRGRVTEDELVAVLPFDRFIQ